jgi:hypothetical protein
MKASNLGFRGRVFVVSATVATAAALTVFGVTTSAQAASHASSHPATPSSIGPGYPPPGGIYAPFTNCPLLNPLMQESLSGDGTGCVAGDAVSGSIKIGNLNTPVSYPVTAQFGIWDPPGATPLQFTGGILPPPAGIPAMLATSPDLVPGGLLKALGCPSATPEIQKLCTEAKYYGGKYLNVYALAQEAGPVSNFALTTWTQPIMIKLINPLLGSYCYIGSTNSPIDINPNVTGTLGEVPDPNPTAHPNTAVLEITNATATDTTFAAPVVTGCGPGGSANIAIDEQLDTYAGLPSASGNNSLTLNGNFYLADCYNTSNQANILLRAFKASEGVPPANGPRENAVHITAAQLHSGRFGF